MSHHETARSVLTQEFPDIANQRPHFRLWKSQEPPQVNDIILPLQFVGEGFEGIVNMKLQILG